MTNCPKTVNGYPVIRSHLIPAKGITREGHIILVDRGPEEHGPRYVTAWLGTGDTSWWKGDYINNEKEANASFDKRVTQER